MAITPTTAMMVWLVIGVIGDSVGEQDEEGGKVQPGNGNVPQGLGDSSDIAKGPSISFSDGLERLGIRL
jgi:hypothetical protein